MSKIRVNYKVVLRYVGYFVFMLLLCFARTTSGVAPFGLGFFVGLIYSKQCFIAIAPMYILSVLVSAPSLITLVVAIVPPIILGAAKGLHALAKRPMRMWQINIYALIAQIPLLIVGVTNVSKLIASVATIILAQVFTYTTSIFLFALLGRGVKYRFRIDEVVAGMILLCGVGMGLYRINIFGFQPFYAVCAAAIILTAAVAKSAYPQVCVAIMFGLGAGTLSGNLMTCGALALIASAQAIFIKRNYYIGIATYCLLDVFVGMYFNAFGSYTYLHFISVALGVIICLCVTPKVREKLSNIYCGYSENLSSREVVTRNRTEINQKLLYVSNVFGEMGDLLLGERRRPIAVTVERDKIAREVAANYCVNCPNMNSCISALGGDTSIAMQDMVAIAIEYGETTTADVNAFLSSRCGRIVGLISAINATVAKYKQREDNEEENATGKLLLGEHFHGVSGMLSELALEIRQPITFDDGRERRIIDELACENILCTDVTVSSIGCNYGLTLLVAKASATNPLLLKVINKVIGFAMEIKASRAANVEGFIYLRLEDSPRFGVCYAVANQALDNNKTSGDSYSIAELANSKFMIALCDGMGTGSLAHYYSSTTISMIESFYKAGFNNNAILPLLNRLLATYNSETFTCLDMSIIDMRSGICDFVKLGAVTSVIKRNNEFFIVEGSALPLGIVQEATPYVERKILLAGDILVMVSDGVTDTLGVDGIKVALRERENANPQAIADNILAIALRAGAKDDTTVIVAKIFLKELAQKVAK